MLKMSNKKFAKVCRVPHDSFSDWSDKDDPTIISDWEANREIWKSQWKGKSFVEATLERYPDIKKGDFVFVMDTIKSLSQGIMEDNDRNNGVYIWDGKKPLPLTLDANEDYGGIPKEIKVTKTKFHPGYWNDFIYRDGFWFDNEVIDEIYNNLRPMKIKDPFTHSSLYCSIITLRGENYIVFCVPYATFIRRYTDKEDKIKGLPRKPERNDFIHPFFNMAEDYCLKDENLFDPEHRIQTYYGPDLLLMNI